MREILGIKLLNVPGERLLLVLRQDDWRQTELCVLQERGSGWREVQCIWGPYRALAMDAQQAGEDVWIVTEVNANSPLEVYRCRFSELLEPQPSPLQLQPVGPVALSEEQAERVVLPGGDQWHVAGPVAPGQWLFSPRFVPGAAAGTLIVNTSDGQAMLVSAEGLPEASRRFALARAATPQASAHASSGWTVAFLRSKQGRDAPFWNLSRYHGRAGPQPGALMVVENGELQNLSESLGLGPVLGFQLLEEEGSNWLFVLRTAAVGRKVSALQRDAQGWRVRATLDLRQEVHLMENTHDRKAGWLLFVVMQGQESASIHRHPWNIPRRI